MGGRLWTAIVVLLGGTVLAVLMLVRAPASTPDAGASSSESAPLPGSPHRALLPRGGTPRDPVDPASPAYEGQDTDHWDALHPSERMNRAERGVLAALGEGTNSEAVERAWMDLSTTRADFFASDVGARRYLELEQQLQAARRSSHE
jgi:hypothetical protein